MIEVKVNGVSSRSIEGCRLTSLGEARASPVRFEEVTVYGMNGNLRAVEAYDDYERDVAFHCESFDAVTKVIQLFQGMNKELEFWHQPGSVYRADYKKADYHFHHVFSWEVTVTMFFKPFRYQAAAMDLVLTSPGVVSNPGTVYAEPVVIVEGAGEVSLTLGSQTMHLTLDTRATIICRHGEQVVLDKNGQVRNTIRKRGPFFELPVGRSGVTWSGAVSRVTIQGNWRYLI